MNTTIVFLALAAAAFAAPVTPLTEARTVKYGDNDIVQIACALGFTTAVVLVGEEVIVKHIVGDSDYWTLEGKGTNAGYLKPTTKSTQTNVTLVGRSGRHYLFVARVSDSPDIMVRVEATNTGVVDGPRLYTESEVETYRKQLAEMNLTLSKFQSTVEAVRFDATQKLATAKAELYKQIKHPYRFENDKKPFFLRSMHHDGRFTYITGTPDEAPAVYEEKDGKPKVVHYSLEDGTYVINKVLANGYLSIGEEKTRFYAR